MKTKIFLFLISFGVLLNSCTKEDCTETYEGITYTPKYAPMSTLRNVSVSAGKPITSNGKIYIKGNYIFLNETDKGFHIIDNSNPSVPRNIAFVNVPGNLDMIAKGNYLIVDNYVDLLTYDISNPQSIQLINRKENALPLRQYNYGFSDKSSNEIIVGFDKKIERMKNKCGMGNTWWRGGIIGGGVFFTDMSLSVSNIQKSSLGGANGQAGSLSRFAVLNNYLYIANRFSLTPIDITNPSQPIVKTAVSTGEIETIYPFKNNLFLGSPNGLFIYGVSNPEVPNHIGAYWHWTGCDPVVVENDIAYVTIRGGGRCGRNLNVLDVIDVSDLSRPKLLKQYQMQNPYGLGVYNKKLGICDGAAGFKLYNATDSYNLQLTNTIATSKAFDVIMNDQVAMLISEDGLYQYNISTVNPQLISKISIQK
jgi:hypothetical protein